MICRRPLGQSPRPSPTPAPRRGRALGAAALGLAAALIGVPAPAPAAEPTPIGLAYRFYVGGLLIGKAVIHGEVRADGYEINSAVSTSGAASWFVKAELTTRSAGSVETGPDGLALRPAVFELDTLSGDDVQDVTVLYGPTAPKSVTADPPFKPKAYEIDPTEQTDTVDPIAAGLLGALLARGVADAARICDARLPIFDGRRRYDLILDGVDRELFEGGTRLLDCRARWRRVGGFKEKHMRRPDYEFTLRVRLEPNGLATPVRAWGSTPFGGAVAVLRE